MGRHGVRFTVRRMMAGVAAVAIVLGVVLWAGRVRRRAAYDAFVAGAYELEAHNHRMGALFYRKIAEDRRRGIGLGRGYEKFFLYTNDHGGRLTTTRQDEWWSEEDTWPADPDREREQARLAALEARERTRSAYFAKLGAKYRRAARFPWFPVEPDPPPPE
jgi:hypothetical protein